MSKNFRREQWKMLLVTMFCYLFFYTGRHNFGWAAKGMAADLAINYSFVGWISFSMLAGYAFGQLINGNLADRFNPRIMVPLGALLSVSCNFSISFAESPVVILVLWAMNGYFQSMAWAPGSRLITNWWGEEERGKAFGFYTMAAGSSSAVTYLLSIYLLQQDMEWRMLFRIPVLFLLAASLVFLVIARGKPSDKGFPDPDHVGGRALPGDAEGETGASVRKEAPDDWKARYRAVFTNRNFLVASLAIGFESMARYGLIIWVPVHYLGSNWQENPHYLWVTFLMPVGMALGAGTFGTISDTLFKGNRVASIRLGMLVSAGIAFLIYITPTANMLAAGTLMLLAGFFVYGPQANFWPLSPDLLGARNTGTGIGFMNMTAYLFAACGEPLLGHVIDRSGHTSSIFIIIGVICLLSVISISFVSYKRTFSVI